MTAMAICQFSGFYSLWKAFALFLKDEPSLGLTKGSIFVDSRQK